MVHDLPEDGRNFIDSILTQKKKKKTLVNFSRDYTIYDEENDVQRFCNEVGSYKKYLEIN